MDFLDPKKRRWHTVRLFTGYALVAIIVLLTATTIVYYANGFGITRQGDVIQNGLVYVSSQPDNAELYVNDQRRGNTNTRLTLPAGTHTLRIQKEGYRTWEKDIEVIGSSVDHVVYPLLLPTTLVTQELTQFEQAPTVFTQTPDRRRIVMQHAGQDGVFEVYDTGNKPADIVDKYSVVALPTELLTASTDITTWEELEWSTNNRHLLLKRTYQTENASGTEYILVDTQRPAGSYNLTRELGANPTELRLRDKQPTEYYLYDSKAQHLQTAKLGSTERQTVARNVVAFAPHGGNDMLLITTDGASTDNFVAVRIKHGDQLQTIRELPKAESYKLDLARYENAWYATFGETSDGRIYIYKNPASLVDGTVSSPIFAMRITDMNSLSFSATAQFIAAQNGERIQVYDIKNGRGFSYAAPFAFDASAKTKYGRWMDGHRFVQSSAGMARLFEYDSLNRQDLVPVYAETDILFDKDYRQIFALAPAAAGGSSVALTVTPLIVE